MIMSSAPAYCTFRHDHLAGELELKIDIGESLEHYLLCEVVPLVPDFCPRRRRPWRMPR